MNEFTKQELEELSFWLTRLSMMEDKMDNIRPIHKKINNMIDNYCEHNQGTTEDSVLIEICKKCGDFC